MEKWVIGKVIKIKYWTNKLFSLIIHAPISPFIAGQFTKLRFKINGKNIQRAYSYVNSPDNKNLEFYITTIPNGTFSLFLYKLKPKDHLMITKNATGFFIINNIPDCKDLWMIATGTALGPYLSILTDSNKNINRFKKIILIHAVKFICDLNYTNELILLKKKYGNKLCIYTIVSRESVIGSLHGRITNLIIDGTLEKITKTFLSVKHSHVMLCGNPQMVNDTQLILKEKYNMLKNFIDTPGSITSEYYW